MTLDATTDIPDPDKAPAQESLTFVVEQAHSYQGRVKVSTPTRCPACGELLKVGSWGYPNLLTGDPRLHHFRHLPDTPYTRRQIAEGRSSRTGLNRDVSKAVRFSHCGAGCGHMIKPGHLIERHSAVDWQHVLCPGLCARCDQPIVPGQSFSPRMPRKSQIGQLRQGFGWKHRRCNLKDLQDRIARDAERNSQQQARRKQLRVERAAGNGPTYPINIEQIDPQPTGPE